MTTTSLTPKTRESWYREPLVWLVILFPAAAVMGGIATLVLAIRSDDGLVVDDYYNRGLEINRDLARDQQAETHGLVARLEREPTHHELRVTLTAGANFVWPAQLRVALIHATKPGLDQTLLLTQGLAGVYTSTRPVLLAAGDWYVHIEADNWRLLDKLHQR